MRQLELANLRCQLRRKKHLSIPPPDVVLSEEALGELVRLMAQAILAVLRSNPEADDER